MFDHAFGDCRRSDEREVTTRFTEWFGPAEGIVVLDRNGDGRIQGQDLFGDQFVTGRDVANGYEDLALLDSNNDGTFDFNDERFHEVQIWQDANSDGIAQWDILMKNLVRPLTAVVVHWLNVRVCRYVSLTGRRVAVTSTVSWAS